MPGYGASSDYRDDVSLDPDLGVVYDATGEPLAEHERRTRLGTKKEETTPAPPAPDPDMYRGLLGEIVREAEPTTEADPVGVLASLLAGVGVLIGPSPYVQVGNTRHPLLVWPLLFGHTGSGRKGEATGTAARFLRPLHGYDELTVTGLSSGEGLIERIKDPGGKDETRPGTADKRLLVVEEEFSAVMARSKREGSTLAAVLRQAWDGRALHVLNRAALSSSGSHVAVIGHVTPREFRLRLADSEMAGGTYNRFLPLYVDRSKRLPLPTGVDPRTVEDSARSLGAALDGARRITLVRLDGAAERLWSEELYDELTATDDEDLAWTEFARRAAPYCLRIAALYAVLAGQRHVGRDDLAAAAALVRYSVASARHVLDRVHRDPRLDRIARAAVQAGAEGMTRTTISGLFSRNLSADQLDALLKELCSGGQYEEFTASTGGRPATRYRVRTER